MAKVEHTRTTDSSALPNWTSVRLGSVLKEADVRARDVPGIDGAPVLSLTKNLGLIPQEERFHHRVARADVSDYKVLKSGWLVYNPYVIWEGAIRALTTRPIGLVSPVYVTWEVSGADPRFIDYMVRTPTLLSEFSRLSSGVVQRRRSIRKTFFQDIEILLPPLDEQRAIARTLRAVEQAKEATEKVIATTRELKRSLMRHLFTYGPAPFDQTGNIALREADFGPVPAHWRVQPLSECGVIQSGVTKGRKLDKSAVVEVPYLRVANVQDGFLDLRDVKTITIKKDELERYRLQVGDVLFTEGGDIDKLGRGHIWRGEVDTCVHQNHIFAVRPDVEQLSPEYLSYLVQSPYGKAYFLRVGHRTTHLASINQAKLAAFPVLIPPRKEQEDIVRMLAAVERKIEVEMHRQDCLARLFDSLVSDLMAGRRRVMQPEVA